MRFVEFVGFVGFVGSPSDFLPRPPHYICRLSGSNGSLPLLRLETEKHPSKFLLKTNFHSNQNLKTMFTEYWKYSVWKPHCFELCVCVCVAPPRVKRSLPTILFLNSVACIRLSLRETSSGVSGKTKKVQRPSEGGIYLPWNLF